MGNKHPLDQAAANATNVNVKSTPDAVTEVHDAKKTKPGPDTVTLGTDIETVTKDASQKGNPELPKEDKQLRKTLNTNKAAAAAVKTNVTTPEQKDKPQTL